MWQYGDYLSVKRISISILIKINCIMIELDSNFTLADLGNVKKESFEIMYNKTRASSWDGTMYITPDKMYFLVSPGARPTSIADIGGAPK